MAFQTIVLIYVYPLQRSSRGVTNSCLCICCRVPRSPPTPQLYHLITMSAQQYRKHLIPLESNPEVFNNLIGLLGAPPSLSFQDVWSLDDLESIPRPVLALILVFPTDDDYEKRRETYFRDSKDDKDVIWFKQTINNACGLYAILHAVANSAARDMLGKSSRQLTCPDS